MAKPNVTALILGEFYHFTNADSNHQKKELPQTAITAGEEEQQGAPSPAGPAL